MSGHKTQDAEDTEWPSKELSPYADWWWHVDRAARPHGADEIRALCFAKLASGKSAFQVVCDQGEQATVARRVPMWHWSLPPGSSDAADGDAATAPGDDPVDETGHATVAASEVLQFRNCLEPLKATPDAVLVVIDTDINPLHDRFWDNERDGEGKGQPRILAHWMMEGRYDDAESRVPFGREVRRSELVKARMGRTEEEALQALGSHSLTEPFAPRGTAQLDAHGTHVLDLAGGTDPMNEDPEVQALRRVPILAVSLPSNRLLSPSGAFLRIFVDQALSWVDQRLVEIFKKIAPWPRVVVNLSYGLCAGPKDGTGYLPEQIKAFVARHTDVRMFMPAGNDGDSDVHAILHAKADECEVGWLVMPADPFSAFAEVWTTGDPNGIGLCLRTPDGHELVIDDLGAMNPKSNPSGALVRELPCQDTPGLPMARSYPLDPGETKGRIGILLCIAPTRRILPNGPVAPGGVWTIRLIGPGNLRADVHLQSERSLAPRSLVGRPSRLVKTGRVAPTPDGTLNAIPIGGCTIVQAIRCSDGSQPRWTSQGDPSYVPPFAHHLSREGERSSARPSLIAAGARSGSTALVAGTSFACALAARAELRDALRT